MEKKDRMTDQRGAQQVSNNPPNATANPQSAPHPNAGTNATHPVAESQAPAPSEPGDRGVAPTPDVSRPAPASQPDTMTPVELAKHDTLIAAWKREEDAWIEREKSLMEQIAALTLEAGFARTAYDQLVNRQEQEVERSKAIMTQKVEARDSQIAALREALGNFVKFFDDNVEDSELPFNPPSRNELIRVKEAARAALAATRKEP